MVSIKSALSNENNPSVAAQHDLINNNDVEVDANVDDDVDVDANNMISIPNPQNWQKVQEDHDHLQKAISELGTKVSNIIQKQETEFLTAYKSHMRNVSRDFHSLKEDIIQKELAIENNVLVKELEKEKEWYKKEALHLDATLTKMRKKETVLTQKLEEIEEDRSWLSNQLKDVMREKNRIEQRWRSDGDNDVAGLDGLDVTPVTEETM